MLVQLVFASLLLSATHYLHVYGDDGYVYEKPAVGLPCTHQADRIQSQSQGRIVNHPTNLYAEHNLESSASNVESVSSGLSNNYHTEQNTREAQAHAHAQGQAYGQAQAHAHAHAHGNAQAQAQGPLNSVPPLSVLLQQHSFIGSLNLENLPVGKVVPTQLIGDQAKGQHSYNSGQQSAQQYANQIHYHHTVPQAHQYQSNYATVNKNYQATHSAQSAALQGLQRFGPPPNAARPGYAYANGGSINHAQHQQYAGQYSHAGQQQQAAIGQLNLGAAQSLHNSQLGEVIQQTLSSSPLDPSVEKHIYVHVPPDDLLENSAKNTQQQIIAPAQARKHYKIIFIKAPTVPAPNYAQLAAAAAPQTEEKTLVYVLVKKPDEPSIEEIQQLQQTAFKSSKPEVYFIKYKAHKEHESPTANSASSASAIDIGFSQVNNAEQTATVDNQFLNSNVYEGNDAIDIRTGFGESSPASIATNSYSTSSSSSSLSSSSTSQYEGHSSYGVPLN